MVAVAQKVFSGGELSPLVGARDDVPDYGNGLRRALNTLVVPHGPAFKRPGTRRAGVANSTSILTCSFVFGVGDAYSVELGDHYMAFWRVDGTQVVQTLTTPWSQAQLPLLRWHQSADVMWFCHPNVPMQELRRVTLTPTFGLVEKNLSDGPYYAQNETGTTLAVSATGVGMRTVVAAGPLFQATDVGRHLRIKAGGTDMEGWTWGRIVTFTDSTHVDVLFAADVATTDPKTEWRLGLFGQATGYPACVCTHQERLALGSNCANTFPRVDLSISGSFETFRPGTADDQAIQLVIGEGSDGVPIVRDIKSVRVLAIVTGCGLMRASGSTGLKMTPLDREVVSIDDTPGAGTVRAIKARNSMLYLDAQGRSLGEVRAKNEVYADAIGFREISIRNEHLLQDWNGIGLAWANKPWNQVVIPRADGKLVMGPYNPDQDVMGLTPHQLGGGGVVLSANVVPTLLGDAIWLLVDRAGVRTMEVLTELLRNTLPDREAVNLDMSATRRDAPNASLTRISTDGAGVMTWRASATVFSGLDAGKAIRVMEAKAADALNMPQWYTRQLRIQSVLSATDITAVAEIDGAPTAAVQSAGNWLRSFTTVSGMEPWNGYTLRGLADGADIGPFTPSVGKWDLPNEAFVITFGLAYRFEVQPMPPAPQTGKGSAVDRPLSGGRPRLRVLRTRGLRQVKPNGTLSGEYPQRRGIDPVGTPPPFYSGDMELEPLQGQNTPVAPIVAAESAYPACILAYAPDYFVGELGS